MYTTKIDRHKNMWFEFFFRKKITQSSVSSSDDEIITFTKCDESVRYTKQSAGLSQSNNSNEIGLAHTEKKSVYQSSHFLWRLIESCIFVCFFVRDIFFRSGTVPKEFMGAPAVISCEEVIKSNNFFFQWIKIHAVTYKKHSGIEH